MKLKSLGLLLVVCGLFGCAKPPAETAEVTTGAVDDSPPMPDAQPPNGGSGLTIAVVPKATAHQFWTTVKAGAEAAGAEAGATIIWKGPSSETDIAGQRSIVEDFVTQRVAAIVLAATDADALVDTAKAAEAAGVKVIAIDSGLNYDALRSYVATDNVAAAKLAGETLIQLIGGQGKVGVIPFVKGAGSSEEREKGFKDAVAAAQGVELAATDYSDSNAAKAKEVTQDMLTSVPDLAGIFGANEPGAVGAAQALKEMNKAGQVKLVGFDGSPEEVELLEAGVIDALVLQDPYKMGYLGVQTALKACQSEPVEKRIDTGVTVVTKANLQTPEVQKLLNP